MDLSYTLNKDGTCTHPECICCAKSSLPNEEGDDSAVANRIMYDIEEAQLPPGSPENTQEFWQAERIRQALVDMLALGYRVNVTPSGELTPLTQQPTGFVKHDNGKPRFDLVPTEAEWEIAKVFTHGAKVYPPHNYRIGTEWSRYSAAASRHLAQWKMRQDLDTEGDRPSGLNHLAHACASLMILLTLQLKQLGTDDRP